MQFTIKNCLRDALPCCTGTLFLLSQRHRCVYLQNVPTFNTFEVDLLVLNDLQCHSITLFKRTIEFKVAK